MPIRACCQSVECTQIPILPMRTLSQPEADDSRKHSLSTGTGRARTTAEERRTLLTTLLGMHTMARRHCEAARRQQARVTAGGPSFDDRTRAGAEKFGPNQPPHRLHAPARSPPRHREVPEGGLHWRSSFRCRSLRCATHSTIHAKNAKSWFPRRVEPTPRVLKVCDLSTGPKLFRISSCPSAKDFERVRTRLKYPGTQGTVSTQSTPHPRAKITPAGRSPCELGWELRDQTHLVGPSHLPAAGCAYLGGHSVRRLRGLSLVSSRLSRTDVCEATLGTVTLLRSPLSEQAICGDSTRLTSRQCLKRASMRCARLAAAKPR
jgi:hypothetical protein